MYFSIRDRNRDRLLFAGMGVNPCKVKIAAIYRDRYIEESRPPVLLAADAAVVVVGGFEEFEPPVHGIARDASAQRFHFGHGHERGYRDRLFSPG